MRSDMKRNELVVQEYCGRGMWSTVWCGAVFGNVPSGSIRPHSHSDSLTVSLHRANDFRMIGDRRRLNGSLPLPCTCHEPLLLISRRITGKSLRQRQRWWKEKLSCYCPSTASNSYLSFIYCIIIDYKRFLIVFRASCTKRWRALNRTLINNICDCFSSQELYFQKHPPVTMYDMIESMVVR